MDMKAIERMEKLVKDKPADRPFIMPLVSGYTAVTNEVHLRDYFQDGHKIAECQIKAWETFKYDAVYSPIDPILEAETLGCQAEFPENNYPYIIERISAESIDMGMLSLFEPGRKQRTTEILKSIRIMRDWLDGAAVVVGNVSGPVTIATQLVGIPEFITYAADDVATLVKLLRFSAQSCVRWGFEMINAGAQVILIHDVFTPLLIFPKNLDSHFIILHYRNIFKQLKQAGDVVTGILVPRVSPELMSLLISRNLNFIGIEGEHIVGNLPIQYHDICPMGTLNAVDMVKCSEMDIYEKIYSIIQPPLQLTNRLIISTNVEIPLDSKKENIESMIQATICPESFRIAA